MTIEVLAARCEALEISVAFQEKLTRDLDDLVRTLADRLQAVEREITTLKRVTSADEPPLGPANEPPPHY